MQAYGLATPLIGNKFLETCDLKLICKVVSRQVTICT